MLSVQIIHHEHSTQKYLDVQLLSLEAQTFKNFEVIIMDSTETGLNLSKDYSLSLRVYRIPRSTSGPKATNTAATLAREGTKYHLWCNDDLIFNKYALEEYVIAADENAYVINPLSNCDNGWLYSANIDLVNKDGKRLEVKRFMDFDEVVGFEQAIIDYPRQSRVYVPQQTHCMYATLIPDALLKSLGGYDTNLLMGYNDTDMSFRYRQAGVNLITCLSAFVWHYGGATTKDRPRDRQTADREYFRKKWNLPEDFDGNKPGTV
jgi:GT2 family glycosyltransferase